MGYSKHQLLARLQELQIEFRQYELPVVLTVEAQAKYVGDKSGALTKNLLLKDKKHRYYIVSALPDTKVVLKVLSQRFGLGKGGLRMAPEEALGQILQVPLGCVTPFALVNESASHVALLLDQGFKTQECCFFHPLSNDMSISLNIVGLDKFLKSIGRVPAYVDLEANPKVGKDQPPDLAVLVPFDSLALLDAAEEMPTSKSSNVNNSSSDSKPATATVVNVRKASDNLPKLKDQSSNGRQPSVAFSDPVVFVEEILNKTCSLLRSEITKDSLEKHSDKVGAMVADNTRKHLNPDLESLAVNPVKYSSMVSGFSTLWREQGPSSFWRGWSGKFFGYAAHLLKSLPMWLSALSKLLRYKFKHRPISQRG